MSQITFVPGYSVHYEQLGEIILQQFFDGDIAAILRIKGWNRMFRDMYAFHIDKLDNGLPIYFQEWPFASWFYTGVVVHAGAREDPMGRSGLAHLVEHLVGENVEGLTFSQLEKQFRKLGGYGWFGETSYYSSEYKFHVPSNEQHIQRALDLFGQMLVATKHLIKNSEEEKAVILREYHRRYEHERSRTWALQGRPWLFEHHQTLSAFDAAIGIPDEFLLSTQQDIQTFYESYYIPRNMSVICIGSLPQQKVLQLLQHSPFAEQGQGQRNSIPAPFLPHPPQKQKQIIRLSQLSLFTQWEAMISCEWVIPLQFERKCVQIFCNVLEEQLIEALRYQLHMTYSVDITSMHYQDCRTIRAVFQTTPESVEKAQDVFWRVLRAIPQQAQEKFIEMKQETLWSIYRLDYSGYDLLESAMGDLAAYQRLISFSEEIQQIEGTTFEQVVELAYYLTYERHFCFVMIP